MKPDAISTFLSWPRGRTALCLLQRRAGTLDAPGAVRATHAGPHPTLRVIAQLPALLLLHCFGGSARSWDAFAARLGPTWRCAAPDMRAFGANHPGGPYAVGNYADDAAALAADLGPFLLVGHSMGGKGGVVQSWVTRGAGLTLPGRMMAL